MSWLTRLSGCFLASLLLVFSSAFHSAHADEAWSFVQITCAPELGYFSIRRFFVMNPPHMGPYLTEGLEAGSAVVAALQRKNGIFDSESLRDNPFDCSIPAVQAVQGWHNSRPGYEVRVVGHVDKISDLISPYTEVFLQGKSLGNIFLNGGGNIDSIEAWNDGALEVRICREKPDISAAYTKEAVCRSEPFKAGAQ